jgi:prepilin-type processing-associated H-X9-DG protein
VGWEGSVYRDNPVAGYRVFKKSTDFTSPGPSDTFVFGEIHSDSICRPFFGIIMTRPAYYHVPANYHGRNTTFAWADGHVASRRWLDARTYSPPRNIDWHGHNYTVAGSQDVAWFQEHATSRAR